MKFEKLVDLLKLDTSTSPWVQKQGIAGMFECLESEIREAKEALYEKGGPGDFQKEMGDVLWTWISVILLTEGWTGCGTDRDRAGVTIEGAIEDAIQKLLHRKPWLKDGRGFPNGPWTAEDELREYEKAKAAEAGWWSSEAEDRWQQLDRANPVLSKEIAGFADLTLDFLAKVSSDILNDHVPEGLIECVFMHPAVWTKFVEEAENSGYDYMTLDATKEGAYPSGFVGSIHFSSAIVGFKVPMNEVWILANKCGDHGEESQRVSAVVRIVNE